MIKKILKYSLILLLLHFSAKAQFTYTYYTSSNEIRSIAVHADTVWLGTTNGVLKRLNDGTLLAHYTIKDGLADRYVNAIAVDNNGNVWCGTNNGLSKYDGTNWTTYTTADGLVNDSVKTIVVNNNSSIWCGTNNGVSKFDGTSWTNYTTYNGLVSNNISTIAEDNNGTIWIGTVNGLSKFDGTNWTTYTTTDGLVNNNIRVIAVDDNGTIWVGTVNGLSKLDGINWTTYNIYNGLVYDYINAIAINNDGTVWFGTNGGVRKFDGTNWALYREEDGLADDDILSIALDSNGNILCGSESSGILIFDGNNWTNIINKDDLACNNIAAIALDKNKNIWIGTYGNGISKFNGTNWITYTTSDGLASDLVKTIAIDNNGNIWCGTRYEGISKFDGTTWTNYNTADGLADNSVNVIAVDNNGNIWCGTGYGLSKFDGTNWTTYTTADGLVEREVNTITFDSEGNMWCGTYGGVSKFNGTNWTNYTTSEGLSNNKVKAITVDSRGNIWCGTYGGGVSMFNGTSWTNYVPGTDGPATVYTNSTAIDGNSNIWFGSGANGEISMFNGTNWTIVPFVDVYDIFFDYNTLWLGTTHGIIKRTCQLDNVSFEYAGNLCNDSIIVLSNNSTQTGLTTNYEWDIYNNGTTDYYTENCTHSFPMTGDYTIKLSIMYENCKFSTENTISIFPLPAINISGTNTLCEGKQEIYTSDYNANYTYKWEVIGGSIISGQDSSRATVEWTASEQNILSLTATNNGCTATQNYNVLVNPLPIINITGVDTLCQGEQEIYTSNYNINYTYNWDIIGGSIISGKYSSRATVKWTASEQNILSLTAINSGCTATQNYNVLVNPLPIINIAGVNTLCEGEQEIYTSDYNANYTYNWKVIGGSIISGQDSSRAIVEWTASEQNILSLTATDSSCTATQNYNVSVNPLPEIQNIIGENNVCANTTLSYAINSESNNLFEWQTNGGFIYNPSQNQTKIKWISTGTQALNLTETNSYGCSTTNTFNVNVSDKELLDIPEIKVKFGSLLIATNLKDAFTDYQWYYNYAPITGADKQFYQAAYPLKGEYYLVAIDKNSCKAESNHLTFNELKLYEDIKVYPNPAKEIINVNLSNKVKGDCTIELFDYSGRKIISQKTYDQQFYIQIQTESLKTGIYFLKIINNNIAVYTGKILIQN